MSDGNERPDSVVLCSFRLALWIALLREAFQIIEMLTRPMRLDRYWPMCYRQREVKLYKTIKPYLYGVQAWRVRF